MATVPIDTFHPDVLPLVPGCSVPMVNHALVNTAVEFCNRTLAWNIKLPAVALSAADYPYAVPTPAHGVVARIKAVIIDGTVLNPTNLAALDGTGDWEHRLGTPSMYLWFVGRGLRVYPLPNTPLMAQVTAAYTPIRGATVLEEFLYDTWLNALVSGSLRKLMAMPNQPWTNPQGVEYHTIKFEQGVREAAVDVRRDGVALSQMSVVPRSFA
jgi:hypothetical protein